MTPRPMCGSMPRPAARRAHGLGGNAEMDLADYEQLQAEFGAMVPKAAAPQPPI